MAMRGVVSRGVVCRLAEGNWQKSGLCCYSDDRGRVLSEEERAKETVYIQKMERERMEKLKKKKAELEKAEKEKSDKKAEGDAHKS